MIDVLTDVLDAVRLSSTVYCQSEIQKHAWALHFAPMSRAAFHIVSDGACWLTTPAHPQAHLLNAGDVVVLFQGAEHLIGDALGSPVCAAIQLEADLPGGCVLMRWGDAGPRTTLVCGTFGFDERAGLPLTALLPPVLHFSRDVVTQAGLAPTIHALIEEANAPRLGKSIVLTRLADVLLVLVIRAWVADPANEARGWLRALRDQPITAALTHMHTAPHQSWTVARLAREVAMSRSAFSARFTELVGEPPLRYLTRWRMQVAARLLKTTALSMHEVAERVGYESGVAFSKAFKRERGINPGRFQRERAVG